MTAKDNIKMWLEEAKKKNSKYLIVVYDTFSHEEFPVLVSKNENVQEVINEYDDRKKMLKVMEVYKLSMNLDSQIGEVRAWHI